jgi:F-type H+-transporting ATPase subunit epsilon
VKLTVTTPFATVLEADVQHVRAEDASGAFGILPRQADFLTTLAISVVIFRDANGREHYLAVRGGVLRMMHGEHIVIGTPEAVASDDLRVLETEVLARFHREVEAERAARTDAARLRLAAIRQIIHLLRPGGRDVPSVRSRVSSDAGLQV